MRRVALALVILVVGCGDDSLAVTEFDEVCGVEGPVRVLPLELGLTMVGVQTLAERRYYSVVPTAGDDAPERVSVWSSGLCGESPRRIAEGVRMESRSERWPDLLIGCDVASGDIVVLDPDGVAAPHVLFDLQECRRWPFAGGILALEPEQLDLASLWFHPYPDDPRTQTAEPVVLLESMQSAGSGWYGPQLTNEGAYALTSEGTVMRIDLEDRSVSEVQAFTVSRDGRYLLWQDSAIVGSDQEAPERLQLLMDRETGDTVSLGVSRFAPSWLDLYHADRGVMTQGLLADQRVYTLPELSVVDVPAGFGLDFTGPRGGRAVVGAELLDGGMARAVRPQGRQLDAAVQSARLDPRARRAGGVCARYASELRGLQPRRRGARGTCRSTAVRRAW